MSVPAKLQTEAQFIQSQVTAATPLQNAPRAQISAMQLNADKLVADTDTAMAAAAKLSGIRAVVAPTLDDWTSPAGILDIIQGVNAVYTAAQNQSDIGLFRGIVGRVASNLNLL